MKRVLLAGEGPNELGGWADPLPYRNPENRGVLESLLQNVAREGWEVGDAVTWKRIHKFRAGESRSAEQRNVHGLVLMAKDHGFDAVAFSRDKDSDCGDREHAIRAALEEIPRVFSQAPDVIGGVAVRRLESWVLALQGVTKSETLGKEAVEKHFEKRGIENKRSEDMARVAREANLDSIPEDAQSLRSWLAQAKRVLAG